MRSDIKEFTINKLQDYYAYSFVAKLVSKEEHLVRIGDILIYLDEHIPNDISDGEYISFSLLRLDICS